MNSNNSLGRRDFLKLSAISLASVYAMGKTLQGAEKAANPERDRFGGWTKKKFDATGFFRTQHDGQRWWLVTPEGYAFISFGVNHYHADWWAQSYNRDNWVRRFESRNPFDEKWKRGFREAAVADMHLLGLNTLGYHTTAPMLTDPPGHAAFPYVKVYEPLRLSHWQKPGPETYLDVFSPEFEATCEAAAREVVEPYADDSMVLGFAMSDCPALTDNEADWYKTTTWPRRLRNLGPKAPGKQSYVETMRKRYPDIVVFNKVYRTQFASWDELMVAEDWRISTTPANREEREDNASFLISCVDRYYSVAKRTLRKFDKNHLFLGDKLNANMDALEGYLNVTSKYTDVVNIQFYARWSGQKALMDKWTHRIGQPFLNGDSDYSVPTESMPNPYGPHARDQAERAEWTREFMENATARPDFIGWHMCGFIDTSKKMLGKEQAQHEGLMTTNGRFYPEMEKVVQDLSSRLYHIAAGA